MNRPARAEDLAAVASPKRKRYALQGLSAISNRSTTTGNDVRKILALPKKSAVGAVSATVPTARGPLCALQAEDEKSILPQVSLPPPRANGPEQLRRLPAHPSLIPVRQREKEVEGEVEIGPDGDKDDEPLPKRKRARTSCVVPQDEAELQSQLDALNNDGPEADAAADAEDELDAEDPKMASEYVADIQRYLSEAEVRLCLPSHCRSTDASFSSAPSLRQATCPPSPPSPGPCAPS